MLSHSAALHRHLDPKSAGPEKKAGRIAVVPSAHHLARTAVHLTSSVSSPVVGGRWAEFADHAAHEEVGELTDTGL